ncbi:hypothetical protein QBC40DRAFT_216277 [Triangularia verruculosa]|uniref:Uncharacterized protein n=1 Tax=Triangularia verruculosa TaxID=2587418 RepID=A0AAN6XQG7_9PEZI|nr:hypothetical protein QBC40DRAFT_216277 [Triangularia verruculosa]
MGLLDPPSAKDATAILDDLARWRLRQWGFVIVRGTYSSQLKWDKFMRLAQEDARDYFEQRRMLDLYGKMVWTVVEDVAALDGASLEVAQEKFREWLNGEEGRQDMEGSVFAEEGVVYRGPRYSFFLFVDDESLESVVDEAKAREEGGYVVKIVAKGSREGEWQEGGEGGEEEELDEDDRERKLEDVRKRVKVNTLVQVYACLLDVNSWYILPMEDGVIYI